MKISQFFLFFCFWIMICWDANGQTVVGMGTENPNPNAVLELVSSNQNQGFLVPRLSTQQRNASGFISKLTNQDSGLMIFDVDEGNFYYWFNGAWQSGLGNLTSTGTVWYTGNTAPDNNLGNEGDFYVLQSTNDVFRKQDGVFLQFGSLAKNENQYLPGPGISITSENEIVNTGDLDTTNELQDLSVNGTVLGLSGSTTTIDLSSLLDGTGTDSQNLASNKTGDDISITIDNGNTITFSVADGDSDNANELQNLSLSGTTLGLSGSTVTLDLSLIQDGTGTDSQNLTSSKVGNDISIAIDNGNTSTFSVADGDSDSANELQDLSLSGTTLSLSGSTTTIDLSPLQDGTGTDSQNLTSSKIGDNISIAIDNGNTTTFSVADGDNDSGNEVITSASLSTEDMLQIQEAGKNYDVDFSGFQKKALPAGQVMVGNASGVASPVSISGDIILNSDGTMTIQLDAITTAKIINQGITTAKIADGAVTKDKINGDLAGNGLAQNTDGSLELNIAGGGIQLSADQLQLMNSLNGEVLIGDGTQVNAREISGDVALANTGAATVTGLQGNPVGTTIPAGNDILTWNGSAWIPQSPDLVLTSTNGASWYSGDLAPNELSPVEAVSGDYYFRTDTELVYNKKDDGTWMELGSWVKPSGTTIDGTIITTTSTPTLYTGEGRPVNSANDDSKPGDLYYNTLEGVLYIKKNATEWQNF